MKLPPTFSHYDKNNIHTYRRIRRAIGILGVALPILLVLFSAIPYFETTMQASISHYYYTHLRELFTGTLCAVGLFLFLYKGRRNRNILKNDSFLTNVAGVMAFGVAFVPTNLYSDPEGRVLDCSSKVYSFIPSCWEWLGILHYGFAAALFLILALISIKVFTIGQSDNTLIPKSTWNENNIYRACGYAILVFIALVPVSVYFELFDYSTLVFEALALFAFGVSWLIKGRALGDKGKMGRKVYREDNPKNELPEGETVIIQQEGVNEVIQPN